jgi:hypothetical protein
MPVPPPPPPGVQAGSGRQRPLGGYDCCAAGGGAWPSGRLACSGGSASARARLAPPVPSAWWCRILLVQSPRSNFLRLPKGLQHLHHSTGLKPYLHSPPTAALSTKPQVVSQTKAALSEAGVNVAQLEAAAAAAGKAAASKCAARPRAEPPCPTASRRVFFSRGAPWPRSSSFAPLQISSAPGCCLPRLWHADLSVNIPQQHPSDPRSRSSPRINMNLPPGLCRGRPAPCW